MNLNLIVIAGCGIAGAGIASAASGPGYLQVHGPSPIRLASARPAAMSRPVLPPLAWGDEADQPPAPRNLAALVQNGNSAAATGDGTAPGAGGTALGPEPPATADAGDSSGNNPDGSAPADPADGRTTAAPMAPGTLLPFFSQPVGQRGDGHGTVVVPLQFTPAPPPAFRSSTATFTKE